MASEEFKKAGSDIEEGLSKPFDMLDDLRNVLASMQDVVDVFDSMSAGESATEYMDEITSAIDAVEEKMTALAKMAVNAKAEKE